MKNDKETLFLQDFTPYDKSLKWEIQDRYYKNRGSAAWLEGEVPYHVTSNSVAARQNAELVYLALEKMEEDGFLKKEEAVNVLEVASGVGFFAINFFNAFGDLEERKKRGFLKRLKYFFTDYSEMNLKEAAKNETISKFIQSGQLEMAVLDAVNPQSFRLLTTNRETPVPRLVAVVANYVHCCLPVKIIRKKDGKFLEKYIRLSLKTTSETRNLKDVDSVLKQYTHVTENLIEEISWKRISEGFFKKPIHKDVVKEGVKSFPIATIIYPYGSFASIEQTLPLLHNGGIILISDKGYSSLIYMKGERSAEPSIHGNSFAHSLNFPLIEILMNKLGYGVSRTTNPDYPIQTMVIEKRRKGILNNLFNKLFVKNNDNLNVNDFSKAGYSFYDKEKYDVAARFYERARKLKCRDAYVYFYLGCSYSENGNLKKAIDVLKKGQKFDYFNGYSFDFQIGYVLHSPGMYSKAIPYYMKALEKQRTPVRLFNVGLCYEYLNKYKKASDFYKEALRLDPKYKKAKQGLKRVQKT